MYKINNNESCDENDWRIMFQQDYLMDATLHYKMYKKHSEEWEHEHCEFCTIKFSEYESDLHQGYCTEDEKYWVCKKCFNDFYEMFKWKVV